MIPTSIDDVLREAADRGIEELLPDDDSEFVPLAPMVSPAHGQPVETDSRPEPEPEPEPALDGNDPSAATDGPG